jgi:hypothetical protein
VLGDHPSLKLPILFQTPFAFGQALVAIARDRLGPRGALGLQRLLGLAQPSAAITAGPQPLGQLVAARLAEQLVLGRVNRGGLLEDLAGDLLVVARRVMRCVRSDLGAVDGDDADLDQPGARAKREHLAEQVGDRRLMAHTEARDRRVIGRLVGRDHPKGDVVVAMTLDPARGANSDRVGIDEHRDHHRRIVRRPTPPVLTIGRIKRGEIHLRDRLQHEPCEVLFGQPLPQTRRQQQLLITITRQEVLRHPARVLNPPDTTRFVRHPPRALQ